MNKLLNILLLFSAVIGYSQVRLDVMTEGEDFQVNKRLKVTYILEITGENMIQETRLRMPDFSKFEIIGNASDQNTVILDRGIANQQIIQWVLTPKQSGRVKIGSATVTVNGKIYKTEPFDIFVREADKKSVAKKEDAIDDLYINMEVENREVYTNQPTVAVLKAYSKNYDNLRRVKNIRLPQQENLNIKPVSYIKSEIEPSGELASQVLAVFMIFPNESGNVEVSPVSANISNKENRILSNKVKLNVKKLPKNSPDDFKNAVGKFDVEISNKGGEIPEVNKPLNVVVKLSGAGNFGNLSFPKIKKSDDYSVFRPKVTHRTSPRNSSIEGAVTAHYVVVPKKAGMLDISTEPFSYFNPETNEYVDLGSKVLNVAIKTHEEVLAGRTPLERVNEYTNNVLETVDNPVITTDHLKVTEKKRINWNALAINTGLLSVLLVGILLFNRMQRRSKKNNNSSSGKPLGTIAETEKEIKESLKADFSDYFSYLKLQLEQEDYAKFFSTFYELDDEMKKRFFVDRKESIADSLQKIKGTAVSEKYRNLQQRIEMEKYSPVHLKEHIAELYDEIVNLYSQIDK